MAERRAIAYLAKDLTSIDALKLSCERDEAQLNSVLVSLMIAKVDIPNSNDLPATVAIYERAPVPPPPQLRIGELIMSPPVPAGSRHLFDGAALIANNTVVVRVFKPA